LFALFFSLLTLPLLLLLFWHFPLLLLSLIYPFPFLFLALLALYAKVLLGIRFGRKSIFALTNILCFLAIPFALRQGSFTEKSYFLYALFHLFLSLPLSYYIHLYFQKLYQILDHFGEVFSFSFRRSERPLTLSTLKSPFKIAPFPLLKQPFPEEDPEKLWVLLWEIPGSFFALFKVPENQELFYLAPPQETLNPLPESLLGEEALFLFFQKYPQLVLYGKFLKEPLHLGTQVFEKYCILDILPSYKGQKIPDPLAWSEVQSLCKIFNLPKIGELGAFKTKKLKKQSPNFPSGITNAYFREWNPQEALCYYPFSSTE
jgi:hypothetical protein